MNRHRPYAMIMTCKQVYIGMNFIINRYIAIEEIAIYQWVYQKHTNKD